MGKCHCVLGEAQSAGLELLPWSITLDDGKSHASLGGEGDSSGAQGLVHVLTNGCPEGLQAIGSLPWPLGLHLKGERGGEGEEENIHLHGLRM